MDSIMVYPGACNDAYPLVFPHPFTVKVKQMVLYDGLPNSGYYPQYNTKDKLVGPFLKKLKLWCPSQVTQAEEVMADKYVRVTLADGRIIHYFMNTTNEDISSGKCPVELKDLLKQAESVFLRGHHPHADVYLAMPKLNTIWVDEALFFDLLRKIPEHMHGMIKDYAPFAIDYDTDQEPGAATTRTRQDSHGDRAWIRPYCDNCM